MAFIPRRVAKQCDSSQCCRGWLAHSPVRVNANMEELRAYRTIQAGIVYPVLGFGGQFGDRLSVACPKGALRCLGACEKHVDCTGLRVELKVVDRDVQPAAVLRWEMLDHVPKFWAHYGVGDAPRLKFWICVGQFCDYGQREETEATLSYMPDIAMLAEADLGGLVPGEACVMLGKGAVASDCAQIIASERRMRKACKEGDV